MIIIRTYSEIDKQDWGLLAETSPLSTWFQTDEAYQFYASNSGEMVPFCIGVLASPKSSPKGKDFSPTPNPFLNQPILNPSLEGRTLNSGENSPFPLGEGWGEACFASVFGAHTADSMQYDLLKANAIENRKNPTEAESVLWNMLKGNNIGYHFRRQHIILDYIVDFICLDKGLVIELDGGYHNNPEQKEYDAQRTAHLQRLGYTELRFKNEELLCDPVSVIAKITETLKMLPSLKGRVGDRLVGVCVGYVTKANSALKQFFTRRAIIIGGPLLAEDISDEELSALLNAVKNLPSLQGRAGERLPIYIEMRNLHDYSRWKTVFKANGFAYHPHLNIQVACNTMHTMSEQRQRQVKKAIKNGAEIYEASSEQEIRDWYQILHHLYREKVRTPLFSEEFFLQFYRNGVGKYLLVKYEGKVIGGMMCPIFAGKAIYEWYVCGLDEAYREQYPSVMATYAAIEYAKQNGLPVFDFMGAGVPGQPYGVRDFKMEFDGEVVEYGRYLHIRKPLLYKIGKWGVKMLKIKR